MEISMFEYLKRGHEHGDFVSSQELNRLGEEGWELVSVVNTSGPTVHGDLVYFFKRIRVVK
jgi:hypothetical protein